MKTHQRHCTPRLSFLFLLSMACVAASGCSSDPQKPQSEVNQLVQELERIEGAFARRPQDSARSCITYGSICERIAALCLVLDSPAAQVQCDDVADRCDTHLAKHCGISPRRDSGVPSADAGQGDAGYSDGSPVFDGGLTGDTTGAIDAAATIVDARARLDGAAPRDARIRVDQAAPRDARIRLDRAVLRDAYARRDAMIPPAAPQVYLDTTTPAMRSAVDLRASETLHGRVLHLTPENAQVCAECEGMAAGLPYSLGWCSDEASHWTSVRRGGAGFGATWSYTNGEWLMTLPPSVARNLLLVPNRVCYFYARNRNTNVRARASVRVLPN